MIAMKTFLFLSVLPILLFSCSTYSEEQIKSFDQQIQQYIKKNNLEGFEKTSSGLYLKIIEKGSGRHLKYGDSVSFIYTGKLLNGIIFHQVKEPVSFQFKDLIACWKETLLELNEGGKAQLISPPQLAYGDYKLDAIPESSILYYEVELIELK